MTWTKFPFWLVYLVAIGTSLAIFSGVIGGGRLTGPGIALSLSVGALIWVARLLFESARALVATGVVSEQNEALAAGGRRRKELEREYYILKRAIKELELDHAMGKVSPEDYGEIRTRYRERAVRVLRQLDQGETYRAQIEADLKARRLARGLPEKAPVADAQAPSEAEPVAAPAPAAPASAAPASAALASAALASASPACSACKTENDSDAVFCKKCGQKLALAAAS